MDATRPNCTHFTADRLPAGGPFVRPSARPPVRLLWSVLALTGAFMIVEVIGGWLSGSLALLADAGHMLTDVGALGLSLFAARIALRPADEAKTYGYQRWEIIAALVNGAALVAITVWVVVEAVRRISNPSPIRPGLFLAVAVAGLIVNVVSLSLLHGAREGNLNTRGAYLHILGDALGSVGAIVAAVIVWATGNTIADPVLSIALALLILVGAWRLVRESTDVLLEAVPKGISLGEVERCMRGVAGVTAVHDLHVWTVASGMVAMSGHAVVPDLRTHPGVLDGIQAEMARLGIGHVTVQLEVEDGCVEPVVPLRPHHPDAQAHAHHHH
ncbi:MAG TPA: cation diffusion facilitator family transporter [Gemmatimonadales bacterium]|nr:cation diffusion facilitator family transporter [Gemmatimonadales bacterium]